MMSAMTFRLAQSFQNRSLAAVQSRLAQQQALLQRLRNKLPPVLAHHLLHCVADRDKLVLYTDSAVWASQLRFYKRAILDAAQAAEHPCEKMLVRLLTDQTGMSPRPTDKVRLPSAENIALLAKSADELGDSQLQQALQKLGATLAKLKDE